MHNRISLFLLMHKKEQAIDEYYRQVGGGWLFCGKMSKNDRFSLHMSEKFSNFAPDSKDIEFEAFRI